MLMNGTLLSNFNPVVVVVVESKNQRRFFFFFVEVLALV
jgi:hypothetical protein